MRLATWNVNGLRARLDFIRIWLQAREPDVVGLQELKIADEELAEDLFAELGYRMAFHGQKGWNGVAILSRLPLESVQRGLPGQDTLGARLLSARVAGLAFTTVYCPNGKDVEHQDFPLKLEWLEALAAHWRKMHRPDELAILCGDFNVAPSALDSWRGEQGDGRIHHTTAERACLQRFFDAGLFDLFREHHPQLQAFSWWDYRGGAFHRGQGLRIDLLLGSAPVLARVRDVEIDRGFRKKRNGLIASDHAPVLVDLEDA